MIIIGLLSTIACKSDIGFEGTLVGNPGRGVASPAENDGIGYTSGEGHLDGIDYATENGVFDHQGPHQDEVNKEIDLLDPSAHFSLLSGEWAGIKLRFNSITLKGNAEISFEIKLNDVELTIGTEEQTILVSETGAYFIEMGQPGFLTPELINDANEETIDSDHPFADQIEESFSTESAIFVDSDQNGELDEEERSEQLLASGTARNDHLNSGDNEEETTDGD